MIYMFDSDTRDVCFGYENGLIKMFWKLGLLALSLELFFTVSATSGKKNITSPKGQSTVDVSGKRVRCRKLFFY